MTQPTAALFLAELDTLRSDAELVKYARYFPVAERGGDEFIGVRMGEVFALAKRFAAMPLPEIEALLESPVHEARVGAVSIMDLPMLRRPSCARRPESHLGCSHTAQQLSTSWFALRNEGCRVLSTTQGECEAS
jgi:hypothetical protein